VAAAATVADVQQATLAAQAALDYLESTVAQTIAATGAAEQAAQRLNNAHRAATQAAEELAKVAQTMAATVADHDDAERDEEDLAPNSPEVVRPPWHELDFMPRKRPRRP